ncbi:MAG: GNAT family protein [Chloroflexota bacterium]
MNTSLLQGELVRLTAGDPDKDAEKMAHWWRDTEFSRLLDSDPARPFTLAEIKDELKLDKPKENAFDFMIRALAGDRLLGFVGLWVDWKNGNAWVGIGIGEREYWGRGYGTEAMKLALRYAFSELNLHRVTLGVFEYNTRAQRSYEKAGFKVEGRIRGELHRDGRRWDGVYMGILREEWAEM